MSSRHARGQCTEWTPRIDTPRRMNGITVVCSSCDCARPMLAMLPHEFTVRVSIASVRSEEHTSELQSLMRISYAVFCLKKKKKRHKYYMILLDKYSTFTKQ